MSSLQIRMEQLVECNSDKKFKGIAWTTHILSKLAWVKVNLLENPFIIVKKQELELLTLRHFKYVFSPNPH